MLVSKLIHVSKKVPGYQQTINPAFLHYMGVSVNNVQVILRDTILTVIYDTWLSHFIHRSMRGHVYHYR